MYAGNPDSLARSLDTLQGKERLDMLLSIAWNMRNNKPNEALKYCEQAISLAERLKDYDAMAKANSFMGVLYRNLGYYGIAFSYYRRGLNISEKHHIVSQLGYAYNNLGNIYLYQEQPNLSIYYLRKADSMAVKNKNYDLQAYALQNIGRAFMLKDQPDSAIKYLMAALRVRQENGITRKMPVTYKYLADAYKLKGDYRSALKYYNLTAKYADFHNDYDLFSDYSYNMADLYMKLNKLDSALIFAEQALKIAKEHNTVYREFKAYEILAKVFGAKKDFYNAYLASQSALKVKDRLFNAEVLKSIRSIQFTEEATKKDAQITILQKDLELERVRNRRNHIFMLLSFIIVFGTIFIGYIIHHKNKQIEKYLKEVREHNVTIQQKNEELAEHAELLAKTNKELTTRDKLIKESFVYAKRIVNSIMAPDYMFEDCSIFEDFFILNKPLEEIGGDFYYFNRFKNFVVLIVADATGHGIPGAFLSIISITIFKDILFNEDSPDAADVLEKFRREVKKFLRQENDNNIELYDSVDVALTLFFPQERIIKFAGARRPLYIIKDKELKGIKGTLATAGYSQREFSFETHIIPFDDVDRLYLFTDGIGDIMKGDEMERFGTFGWRQLLIEIQNYTMAGQKNIIEQAIQKWTENGRRLDDILIIGVELAK